MDITATLVKARLIHECWISHIYILYILMMIIDIFPLKMGEFVAMMRSETERH